MMWIKRGRERRRRLRKHKDSVQAYLKLLGRKAPEGIAVVWESPCQKEQ